jgi:hypothetical protein
MQLESSAVQSHRELQPRLESLDNSTQPPHPLTVKTACSEPNATAADCAQPRLHLGVLGRCWLSLLITTHHQPCGHEFAGLDIETERTTRYHDCEDLDPRSEFIRSFNQASTLLIHVYRICTILPENPREKKKRFADPITYPSL